MADHSLAKIALFFTVLFGVPPLVGVALGTPWAAGVVIVMLALALVFLAGALWVFFNAPTWSVLHYTASLELGSPRGEKATFRKTLNLRANRRGADVYTHRGISYDGEATHRVDNSVRLLRHHQPANTHSVTVQFQTEKRYGQKATTWIEFDCEGTFAKSEEGLSIDIGYPTKKLTMDIQFPNDRIPKRVWGVFVSTGKREEMAVPALEDGKLSWNYSRHLRNLPFGEYEIRWQW